MAGLRRVPGIGAELVAAGEAGGAVKGVDIVGPLCTPLDNLARGVDVAALTPGAVVSVPNVGAYGLTASLLCFLSRETPVEIVMDGDDVVDVSRLVVSRQPTRQDR
jgi:diaminopimelate decarboxylase